MLNKQKKRFLIVMSFLFLSGIHLKTAAVENKALIVIQEQGSFSVGGVVIHTQGTYKTDIPLKSDG